MEISQLLRRACLAAILSLLFLNPSASLSQDLGNGEVLFNANCKRCHLPWKDMTGPALNGVMDRWDTEENLIKWVKGSQAMVAEGHPYSVALFEKWNGSIMPDFPNFSDEEVMDMISYANVATDGEGGETVNADCPTEEEGDPGSMAFMLLLGSLVLVLLIAALVLSKVIGGLDRALKEKAGETLADEDPVPFLQREWVQKLGGLVGLFVFLAVGYGLYVSAANLGRQPGYQPTQPIKFSHKLHAGKLDIDCQYCHVGAERGKSAVIPSTNICMNCHKGVEVGPCYGTEEIDKIYASAGWDKETKTYDLEKAKPIEWVRIHNLPDHVYFNHAQHVQVGKIDCEDCHGDVAEMDEVKQHQNLSMGWCVNCHRETPVQFAENEYYHETFEELHEQFKNNGNKIDKSLITEGKLGGTECQKCHY